MSEIMVVFFAGQLSGFIAAIATFFIGVEYLMRHEGDE